MIKAKAAVSRVRANGSSRAIAAKPTKNKTATRPATRKTIKPAKKTAA